MKMRPTVHFPPTGWKPNKRLEPVKGQYNIVSYVLGADSTIKGVLSRQSLSKLSNIVNVI